jgi:uracil-DNA glycosylase
MNDAPRTLASREAQQQRNDMLALPHIAPLTKYVDELRAEGFSDVPYFDPMDGGTKATSLFLLEKPGPKASSSGFISRNNNDKTAENTYNFMKAAKIDRATTCLWNTIPGWNGTRKITSGELQKGAACLRRLFALLPNLRVVVLVGKRAQAMAPLIDAENIAILRSYHPSPINYAAARERWASIPREWMRVHDHV